ncbi:hypothetical protein JCM16303_002484 [Sporobolomyces ruberrimus]
MSGAQAFLPTPPPGVAALSLWLKGVDAGLLHPTPTPGFEGRLIALFTLSTVYTVLAAAYGIVSIVRTEERPRTKALWFCRFVSRSSGRFIVLNPRMAWSFGGVIIGLWSICLVWYNYQAFLQGGDQAAMWGVRAMNHWVWFVVGWPVSWAGAQAFLLTSDAPKSLLPSARKSNLLFLVGGTVLAAFSFAFGLYQSIRGRQYWFAGGALRNALLEMLQSSPSGSPTREQMAILVPLADKTAETWHALKTATIIHASFSPIPTIACLIVNLGGIGLVMKLRKQVRESTNLLSLSNPGRFTSDDPADWRGPSPVSTPMSKDESSNEKISPLPSPALPPTISYSGPPPGDSRLTTLQNLKRAELDMAALTIFFIISSLAYTAAFIMADFVMSVDAANTWPLAEGAFGASLWSTVIIGPLLYAFLLYNTASNRLVSPSNSDFLTSTQQPELRSFPSTTATQKTATNRLASLVPILKRTNSATPMMSEPTLSEQIPREIMVVVQVQTEEYDDGTPLEKL